jgi:glycosyltransferase involved in cell wall biosynthesis
VTAGEPSGVSFVVPVHNGAAFIVETLESIFAQDYGGPREVIVVDDRSDDDSREIVRRFAERRPLTLIAGEGRGAAAALNAGVRAASHPFICQVDQDVVLHRDWTRRLVAALDDSSLGAAQGYYVPDPRASLCARVMGLDLALRYDRLAGREVDHVCTGNSVYRRSALMHAGWFDPSMGYGYDNDMSYRLRQAGYGLVFCREARSRHRWREGIAGYLRQQFGFGYGRLELVARHPRKICGDVVSPAPMMAHAAAMPLVVGGLIVGGLFAALGGPWRLAAAASLALLSALALERLAAGIRGARRYGDPAALLFPALHVARDVAWLVALCMWLTRRLARQRSRPRHSMRPRGTARAAPDADSCPAGIGRESRGLAIIPAYNEQATLRAVVDELRARQPQLDLLVVDDGSTDRTGVIASSLGVPCLVFPERLGIGSAMRAGLRYASRMGYDFAVRLDGDGQHRATDIDLLLSPLRANEADVVLGSRFTAGSRSLTVPSLVRRSLAMCLSTLTRSRVTDPTSGFCAIGPTALPVLADHHPTGYPEPELRLFLNRNRLRAVEVGVRGRQRLGGTTSLTAVRLAGAAARVLLAMVIVPLRGRVWVGG